MKKWRFIFSGHQHPSLNMAVDEALLEMHVSSGTPILRIYGWKPHGFSLGYSQDPELVLDTEGCARDGVPFVKRATGGGIIFHGDEVTYSLACSEDDVGNPVSVKEAYRLICSFLMETYRRFGLDPHFAIDVPGREKIKSTFCFSSFEDYDILVKGKKIGGNAQKRKKKFILQHGSIPLSLNMKFASKYVREPLFPAERNSTSLGEAMGKRVEFEEFAVTMKESFITSFDAILEESAFSAAEEMLIEKSLVTVKSRT